MPLESAMTKFLTPRQAWEGTASELLAELGQYADSENWPKPPKGLTQQLKEQWARGLKNGFQKVRLGLKPD